MEEKYPSATVQDLANNDSICIVCREEMIAPEIREPTNTLPIQETPKKLPCGHIFHFRCLRNWLERQQACPTWFDILTSRRSVLEIPTPTAAQIPPVELGEVENVPRPIHEARQEATVDRRPNVGSGTEAVDLGIVPNSGVDFFNLVVSG